VKIPPAILLSHTGTKVLGNALLTIYRQVKSKVTSAQLVDIDSAHSNDITITIRLKSLADAKKAMKVAANYLRKLSWDRPKDSEIEILGHAWQENPTTPDADPTSDWHETIII